MQLQPSVHLCRPHGLGQAEGTCVNTHCDAEKASSAAGWCWGGRQGSSKEDEKI